MGGLIRPYCCDGGILGSVISGDNDCGPDIQIRLAIGRAKYNQLYRTFTRQKMNLDLRIRLYESFVLGTLHGYQGWLLDGPALRAINGWNSRMLSAITKRTPADEARRPTAIHPG